MLSESQTLSHNKNKEADMSDLFKNHGIQIKGILSLTPRETHDLVSRGAFLIDLRDIDFVDYKAFDVPNVLNLPLNGFEKHLKKLDKKGYYILADSSGLKSRDYVQKMLDKGFMHAGSMSGGFIEWERDGMPVRIDVNERLTGSCACQLKPREREK
jgi:rhodanese-related sulfurtransferase